MSSVEASRAGGGAPGQPGGSRCSRAARSPGTAGTPQPQPRCRSSTLSQPRPPRTPDTQGPSQRLEQRHRPRHAPAAALLPFPSAISGAAPAPFPRSPRCSRAGPARVGRSRAGGWGTAAGKRSLFPAKWNLSTCSWRREEAPGGCRDHTELPDRGASSSGSEGVPGDAGMLSPRDWDVPGPDGAPRPGQSPAAVLLCLRATAVQARARTTSN